jgi:pseudouridine synthase
MSQEELRLQKILAQAGISSRRKAEDLIKAGRVKVNGRTVTQAGTKVSPQDAITVDNEPVGPGEKLCYYMFHKPKGFLTALSDPYDRPTISQFLRVLPVRVYPVGRLDNDVSGILILTNDGELARRLMHPSFEVPKIYRVLVNGQLTKDDLLLLSSGELIIDGKPAAPARARLLTRGPDKGWLELTLTEGRHRQVKKMCASVGHPVEILKRVAFSRLNIDPRLAPGQIRALSNQEILTLKTQVRLNPDDPSSE